MKKIISMLLAVIMVLSLGSISVFAEEDAFSESLVDWSRIGEFMDLNNDSCYGYGCFIEESFDVVGSYLVEDKTANGYNCITEDGTITITNNADDDKYVMYVNIEPLRPNGDGSYSNMYPDIELGFPEFYTYGVDNEFFEGEPTEPMLDTSTLKLFKGDSITFSIPKEVAGWNNEYTNTFDKDMIWVVHISSNHGYYREVEGEYSNYTEFVYTDPSDMGYGMYWFFKVDDNKVNERLDYIRSLNKFSDVDIKDYFCKPILWALDEEITKGTTETTFSPNDTCTHDQILTFLWRANGSPIVDEEYSWIKDGEYYTEALKWAASNNLIDEYYVGIGSCSRYSAVKYMFDLTNIEDYPTESADVMTDLDSKNPEAVAWAMDNGVTMGTSETTFSPEDTCTRGQIITFLYRGYAE